MSANYAQQTEGITSLSDATHVAAALPITKVYVDPKTCKHSFLEREVHECEHCNKAFSTAYNLNRHKKGNCQENVCRKCNVRFSKTEQLQEHNAKCTGKQPYQCEFCAKAFVKNSNLMRHRLTHTERCEFCNSLFYKRIPLITLFPEEQLHNCQHCELKFKTEDALEKHTRVHYDSNVNQCSKCLMGFEKKRHLDNHVRLVHPEEAPPNKQRKTYECSVCNRVFSKKKERKKHVQTHLEAGLKIHTCKVCNKSYRAEKTLKMHMIKHGSDDKKPRCKVCSKIFSHPFSLRYHMRIHNNSKPCVCKVCNQAFRQAGHLKRHLLTHSDTPREKRARQFRCDMCSRLFLTVHDLKQHKVTHNAEKRFTCPYCGKQFLFKRMLEHHVNTHTGAKPYACNTCDKSFAQPGSLHKHKQTHVQLPGTQAQPPPSQNVAKFSCSKVAAGVQQQHQRANSEPKQPAARRSMTVQIDANNMAHTLTMPQIIVNNSGAVSNVNGGLIQIPNSATVATGTTIAAIPQAQPAQSQPILLTNQLQPIHNTPPILTELEPLQPRSLSSSNEHLQRAPTIITGPDYRSDCLEPFALQHVHLQFHNPHQSAFKQKAPSVVQELPQSTSSATAAAAAATYWTATPNLQQPNIIHYQPNAQNVQMFLQAPNNQHLQ